MDKRKAERLLEICLLLLGIGLLSYPLIGNFIAEKSQSEVVQKYAEAAEAMSKEEKAEEIKRARRYNQMLTGKQIEDPFMPESGFVLPEDYVSILNIGGVIGHVDIEKIDVHIPIYHGTSAEVLEKGVGHLQETDFPVGGATTHCVLTGHRGLPSAKLFTDLDKVEEKDVFTITVLDEVFRYEVDQIKVVDPSDTKDLKPIEGGDYVTLITCTPYRINSHRLLVRGKRIPDEKKSSVAAAKEQERLHRLEEYLIIVPIVLILISMVIYFRYRRQKKRRLQAWKDYLEYFA